jgi:riboflavin biosynthesis pyrimidine reductase
LTTQQTPTERGDCEPIVVPSDEDGYVNLQAALEILHERGIRNLMVEGGASVITAFLRSGLADAVVLTVAPMFIGGYNAIGQLGDSDRKFFPQIDSLRSMQLGNELMIWGKLRYNNEAGSE